MRQKRLKGYHGLFVSLFVVFPQFAQHYSTRYASRVTVVFAIKKFCPRLVAFKIETPGRRP